MKKSWELKQLLFFTSQGQPEIASYKHKARFMDLGINLKIITETYDGKQSRPDL